MFCISLCKGYKVTTRLSRALIFPKAQMDQDPYTLKANTHSTCLSCSHPSAVEQVTRGKNSREKRLSSRDQAFWAMGAITVVVWPGWGTGTKTKTRF